MRALFQLGGWLAVLGRRRAWIARREHRSAAFLAYSAAAVLGELFMLWWTLTLVLGLALIGEWAMAAIAACFASALSVRRIVVERVAIPLGWYRVTHLLAEIDAWLGDEPAGHVRLTAARALARAGNPPAAHDWWRRMQVEHVGAHDVAAAALLADAGGDRAGARALFESLALLRAPAPHARELAAEWLALDDAEAGRWRAILDRAAAIARPGRGYHRRPGAIAADHAGAAAQRGQLLWPATGLTYFLEGVAARLLAEPEAPSRAGLWVRWLEAPRHRATWPLLQRALAATAEPPPVRATDDDEAPAPATTAPLADAIARHTAALARPAVETAVAAAAAWDAALTDASWRTAIAERAITLGAPSDAAARAVDELRAQAVADLAAAILGAHLPLPALLARAGTERGILGAAAARARAELLARLELTFERVGGRVHDRAPLAPLDEWRSFLAVRAAYLDAAAQGGDELERLAYPHAHSELTTWSVWMWNDRKQHALSHGMTSWLYERALAVGDAQAIELHGKNAELEPPDA